uniref:Uncharacterized protein n=1 Tax=Caenorhabditis japonica TaxID=281687 RepID=A0A8R1IIM4_CAEJA
MRFNEVTDENENFIDFTVIKVNSYEILMFLAASPTQYETEEWNAKVESVLSKRKDDRRNAVNALMNEMPDGFRFSNRLFTDTTFNVGGLYLTQILGELSSVK